MKMILFAALLVITAASAQNSQVAPTAFQIAPSLATTCSSRDAPASYVSGDWAYIDGYVCTLKVHAGRGSGVRIVSGCAEVDWNADGSIADVTPYAMQFQASSITCP